MFDIYNYKKALDTLNPYDINYLNFGRRTGKSTFAKELEDAWVFTPYLANARTYNFFYIQRLNSLAYGRDSLRGLRAPKYLVLDEYTDQMLADILRLQLRLSDPNYRKGNEVPVIIVLGDEF